jgi:rare lipoprotein A
MRAFLAALTLWACTVAAGAATASWYGYGRLTASGERFDPNADTAAMWGVPFGTMVRVCLNGCVTVRINDRGPAKYLHRDIDLSRGAAVRIGLIGRGVAPVRLQIIGGRNEACCRHRYRRLAHGRHGARHQHARAHGRGSRALRR